MATITSITLTEVIVPACPGAIDSPDMKKPLHKLPVKGQAGWSIQFDELPKVILQIQLDDGVIGLGECYRGHNWDTLEGISRKLLGKSWADLCLQDLPIGWCREYDGFECALWDAYARCHDLRVVDLLGGPQKHQIRVGAWSSHRHLDEIAELAANFDRQGYDTIKFKCDLQDDVVGWCREIKRAAPAMKVILDPNERWDTPAAARERIDGLREVGNLLCLEDPIPRWMLEDYADLRTYSPIPIVLHVALPYIESGQRAHDAIRALQERAVDGFNFNAGLANFQRLDAIASAAGLPCWHGSEVDLGILEAMYLHSSAAAKSCVWPGDIFGRLIRSHDLLKEPLEIVPPFATLPEGKGLGVELDHTALKIFQREERTLS